MPSLRIAPKVMTLTDAAASRVRALMASKGQDVKGLKIGVKKGGCAGMEYTMTWADKIEVRDEVIEQDGAIVLIEPSALMYLLGTEMDYKTEKLGSQFVFNNPNQKSACGCGEKRAVGTGNGCNGRRSVKATAHSIFKIITRTHCAQASYQNAWRDIKER